MNLDVTYSIGGTEAAPLVARTVPWPYDPESPLQEQLLARTDALLQDLCAVFDTALVAFDAVDGDGGGEDGRGLALDTMVAVLGFATGAILQPCPSIKAVCMQDRSHRLGTRLPLIRDLFGDCAVEDVEKVLTDTLHTLQDILCIVTNKDVALET